jgi:competence ComEA-like helix-hairpin-helix protein
VDNTQPFNLIEIDDEISGPLTVEPARRRAQTEPAAKLDINTATFDELRELPGVGPLRARRIIEWRTRNRRFDSLEDLHYVRGFGPRFVMELIPYLTVAE